METNGLYVTEILPVKIASFIARMTVFMLIYQVLKIELNSTNFEETKRNMIKKIVILGGGTAGWITAGIIATRHKTDSNKRIEVVVVESPNIPIIGVGEGSWPSLVNTVSSLGISETDLIKHCDVSFKQGIQFEGWKTGNKGDTYLHPFSNPIGPQQFNLVPHWQNLIGNTAISSNSFAETVTAQSQLCFMNKAPKDYTHPDFKSAENYGYHLDAGKFSNYLKSHCKRNLNVRHIEDDIVQVIGDQSGDIAYLQGKKNRKVEGDLFVDCSGMKSLLIGQFLKVRYNSKRNTLFADSALAIQLPYQDKSDPISSMTRSVAQSEGWIWDIGLPNRKGIGYVYSSQHTNQANAEKTFKCYLSQYTQNTQNTEALEFKKIEFDPGHREKFWVKNCVAVGMSAGFLEPLEASAIGIIELSARMIADHLPASRQSMDIVAENFNHVFLKRWELIIDFLKMHYSLSDRRDSQFWIDNANPDTSPDSLLKMLQFWREQSPCNNGFMSAYNMFPLASYQYVLYGMGFKTKSNYLNTSSVEIDYAKKLFNEVNKRSQHYKTTMPSNRELINHILKK